MAFATVMRLSSQRKDTVEAQNKIKNEFPTHSIQPGLSAREREREAQRETSVLHAHVVQEVTDTLHNVIKQLE